MLFNRSDKILPEFRHVVTWTNMHAVFCISRFDSSKTYEWGTKSQGKKYYISEEIATSNWARLGCCLQKTAAPQQILLLVQHSVIKVAPGDVKTSCSPFNIRTSILKSRMASSFAGQRLANVMHRQHQLFPINKRLNCNL